MQSIRTRLYMAGLTLTTSINRCQCTTHAAAQELITNLPNVETESSRVSQLSLPKLAPRATYLTSTGLVCRRAHRNLVPSPFYNSSPYPASASGLKLHAVPGTPQVVARCLAGQRSCMQPRPLQPHFEKMARLHHQHPQDPRV